MEENKKRKLVCEFRSVLNVIDFEISLKPKRSFIINILKFFHLVDESELFQYPMNFKFTGSSQEFQHYFSKIKNRNFGLLKTPSVKEFLEKVTEFIENQKDQDFLVEAKTV